MKAKREKIVENVIANGNISVEGGMIVLPEIAAKNLVNKILTATGYFELLEVAEKVVWHKCTGSKEDRPDYVTMMPCSELYKLDAVIAKIRGEGEKRHCNNCAIGGRCDFEHMAAQYRYCIDVGYEHWRPREK